jgi:hypothetical protein
MKTMAALVLSLTTAFVTQHAAAADSTDRPAGVEERHWIPITERLGFVVLAQKKQFPPFVPSALVPPSDSVSAELMPPEKGYFMVRTSTGWRRLVVTDASDLTG